MAVTAPGGVTYRYLVRQKALEQTQKVSPQAQKVSLMVALTTAISAGEADFTQLWRSCLQEHRGKTSPTNPSRATEPSVYATPRAPMCAASWLRARPVRYLHPHDPTEIPLTCQISNLRARLHPIGRHNTHVGRQSSGLRLTHLSIVTDKETGATIHVRHSPPCKGAGAI